MSESRRDRSKQDKRDRIFRAAADLFAERGFAGVTTQQIADRADVAAGTVFRYAATKGELVLMVRNAAFAAAIDEGERAARFAGDAVDAIWALLQPVLDSADAQPENTVAYQRELLFGAPDEQHRAEGLRLVDRLTDAVAAQLEAGAGGAVTADDAHAAARTVFAALHLALVGEHPDSAVRDAVLRTQLTQIVRGSRAARP